MMSSFELVDIQHQVKSFSSAFILKNIQELFDANGHVLFLFDITVAPDSFCAFESYFVQDDLIYLPLAQGNHSRNTHLFFVRITTRQVLDTVAAEFVKFIQLNHQVENNQFIIQGFGATQLDNDVLSKRFKKSVIVNDIDSKIILRWYDPRVLIYLDEVFSQFQVNSLLSIFKHWHFIHPKGYFIKTMNSLQRFRAISIKTISLQQSILLDLIEISNLVYRKLNEFSEVDLKQVEPRKILGGLLQAHEHYEIKRYSDLVAYGLYAQVLGDQFMMHPLINEILKEYWDTAPKHFNFAETMDLVSEAHWPTLRNDLFNFMGE